ncbi:MAG: hypothetical protein ABFE07_28250 [Armatimonadia bacterium]
MIRTVRIDNKAFTHTQAEKLVRFLRDRHGFILTFTTSPDLAPATCWTCILQDSENADMRRHGESFWDCLSRAALEICKPIIEEERKGGN